jgi:hypothetical protein
MNRDAMAHEIRFRDNRLFQRRIDVVEINIGDETIDAAIDARRLWSMQKTLLRNEIAQHIEIGEATRESSIRRVAADALKMIALRVEVARLLQIGVSEIRMLRQQRIVEQRPEALIFPARIGHHPIEIIEHARYQEIPVALLRGQSSIERQPIFLRQKGDNRFAVADRLAVIDDVRQLAAWRVRRIDDVLVAEGQTAQAQEGIDLQPIAVVVGDAEQLGIGKERQHAELSAENQQCGCSLNFGQLQRE